MRIPEDLSLSKQSVPKIWNIEDTTVNTVPNENANFNILLWVAVYSHKVYIFDFLFLDILLVGISLQIFLWKMLFVHDPRSIVWAGTTLSSRFFGVFYIYFCHYFYVISCLTH